MSFSHLNVIAFCEQIAMPKQRKPIVWLAYLILTQDEDRSV